MPSPVAIRTYRRPVPTREREPGRRAVLLAAFGGLLAACTEQAPLEPAPTRSAASRAPGPDAELRARVVADKDALIQRIDQVTTSHPDTAEPLRIVRQAHGIHREAVRANGPLADTVDRPVAQPSPAASAQEALTELAENERVAAGQRLEDCLAARDAELASLLAGVRAGERVHIARLQAAAS